MSNCRFHCSFVVGLLALSASAAQAEDAWPLAVVERPLVLNQGLFGASGDTNQVDLGAELALTKVRHADGAVDNRRGALRAALRI